MLDDTLESELVLRTEVLRALARDLDDTRARKKLSPQLSGRDSERAHRFLMLGARTESGGLFCPARCGVLVVLLADAAQRGSGK